MDLADVDRRPSGDRDGAPQIVGALKGAAGVAGSRDVAKKAGDEFDRRLPRGRTGRRLTLQMRGRNARAKVIIAWWAGAEDCC